MNTPMQWLSFTKGGRENIYKDKGEGGTVVRKSDVVKYNTTSTSEVENLAK